MYNIFQPILSVDQAMNAEIDTYEMLIRNNNGEFPGINFLHSLTTQEGNDAWIKASHKSIKNALNEQQNRKIYVNTDLKLSEITGLKMYFFTGLNAVLYVVPCNLSCDMIYQKF